MELTIDIIIYVGLLIQLINIILYFKSHAPVNRGMSFNILKIYLILIFIISLVSKIYALEKINNLYLSHLYFVTQFILLSIFYLSFFNRRQQFLVKLIFVIVLIVVGIQYGIEPTKFFSFNLPEVFITSFPLVIYSIIHLYNSLTKNGEFLYINAAILIYISASTLIFFLGNYLAGFDRIVVANIWLIQNILYLIFLILIFLEWQKNLSKIKT